MVKHLVAFLALVISTQGVAQNQPSSQQSSSQKWECALNLHQGDTGTLSLDRTDDTLRGMINLTRNESNFDSEVSGSWIGDKINLTRLLDSDSSESMTGVAVALGTEKVNIGGRYSTDYQGVWSANCDLVSQATIAQQQESSDVQPSVSSRVRPNAPSNKDQINFSTLASHPDGIAKVSFFLGSNEIHSCDSERCEFTHGPLATGVYGWRVEATSKSGIKNEEDNNQLSVSDSSNVNNCTLSGNATGPSAPLAEVYLVKLFGPDNTNLLNSSAGFENGRYQFADLAAGEYKLFIDTQGDQEILASPAQTTISCQSQSTLSQDIEFR